MAVREAVPERIAVYLFVDVTGVSEPVTDETCALLVDAPVRVTGVVGMAGIFIVAPDGGDVRWVVRSGGGVWANAPVWSPDGRWLAYVSNRDASIGADYGDLYIVPASGGQPTRLTSDGRTYEWRAARLP